MVELFLIQHGEAKTKDEDPAKPLTEHGAAVVEKMAAWAARAGVQVSEIRHSGKLRAEQTAEIFGRHLAPERGVVAATGLNPKDDVEPLARELASRQEPLMVVGHLPFLDRLASRLVAGDPAAGAVRFTNAGIVCLCGRPPLAESPWGVTLDGAYLREISDSGIFDCYAGGMDGTLARRRLKLRRLLRAIRRESGLTQVELAERLGLSQSMVSKWEGGQREVGFFEVVDLCKAVGMSFESFCLRWEATPDTPPPAQDR